MTRQDPALESKFFDHYAKEYGDYHPLSNRAHQIIIKKFEALVPVSSTPLSLLDLGCGSGFITELFTRFPNLNITACDISAKGIEIAKSRTEKVNYYQMDLLKTSFKDESFSIITCCGVLHHFPNYDEVLKEVFRLLVPGGCFFAFDPNLHNPFMWLYRHRKSPFFSPVGITENEFLLTRKMVKDALQKQDFSNIEIKACGGMTFRSLHCKKTQILLPIYNFFEAISTYLPFSQYFGSMIFSTSRKSI